ncbi:hypothetical protein AN619_16040 [Thermotalea metallivorans]|uniref:LarC family nickel insertion protein n=1 Tax=Thermotalea metallivorans TaxID=520762 RepID=A0A140L4Y3_9FIRM|nr:hypothetical protein AN619_16040 [Thermotalea metallivorans]
MLECNIDDMNPEFYGYVMEKGLEAGALDIFMVPVIMKKNRPGILLSVLCEEDKREELEQFIFMETTTLGIRRYAVERSVLERKVLRIRTKYGVVGMKVGFLGGKILKYAPEYEDCKEIAENFHLPLKKVYEDIHYAMKKYIESM